MKKCATKLDQEEIRFIDAREKIKSAIDRILKEYSSCPLTIKKEQEFAVYCSLFAKS